MEQSLYKVSSAMKKLDVCRATIYRLISRGELEMVKIGSTTRITSTSIERLVAGKSKS